MPEHTAMRVADFLRAGGVKGVVISGGEPTLLPYLPRLTAALAENSHVVLSTNGLAPIRRMERVLPHLSWIALPIESADRAENDRLRTGTAPHFERVLVTLREVRKNHRQVRIKLGTVITRWNVDGAARVLDVLDDKLLPDVWKIYQLAETNYGADNAEALRTDDFEQVVRRCEKAAANRGVSLRVYRNSDRTGSYLFIDPDCEVVVIRDGQEHRMGNLFDLPGDCDLGVVAARNGSNFMGTYPIQEF